MVSIQTYMHIFGKFLAVVIRIIQPVLFFLSIYKKPSSLVLQNESLTDCVVG